MAWRVTLIVDPAYSQDGIDQLVRYSPIWIVETPCNRMCAEIARHAAGEMWAPEATCTTFSVTDPADRELNCLRILDQIDLHHYQLSRLDLIGVKSSSALLSALEVLEFVPVISTSEGSISLRKPVNNLNEVPLLLVDGSHWINVDDVYDSLFAALGSPAWHGRNIEALNDSIVTGGINAVEVPYKLIISGSGSASLEVRQFVSELAAFISKREAEGCPISIKEEN